MQAACLFKPHSPGTRGEASPAVQDVVDTGLSCEQKVASCSCLPQQPSCLDSPNPLQLTDALCIFRRVLSKHRRQSERPPSRAEHPHTGLSEVLSTLQHPAAHPGQQ